MKRGRVTLTLSSAGLCLLLAAPASAGDWPLWPTQIEQSTRALEPGSDASESARIAELRQLENAPDAIATPYIVRALDDESTEMRRLAMRACVERRIEGCLSAAELSWMESSDPAIRLRSLQLLALFPNEERLETLLQALDGNEPSMRDQASESLASARLSEAQEKRLRTVLQAKLDDQSATVRRRAAITLGMRGPGGGTVSLIRHLDDPDPAVRTASAQALGRLGDVRALPALRRALDNTPDRALATQIIATLGLLPGEEVDALLLNLFDRPPFKRRNQVVAAIGTRKAPGKALIDGLIARLRDPDLHDSALKAIRWLGEGARPRLEAALDRGLEASLAAELRSVLDALEVDADQTGPQGESSVAAIVDETAQALQAARARLASPVKHTGAWIVAQAMRADQPHTAREALFTLALWDAPSLPAHDLAPLQTRLARWVGDARLDADARCLAAAALTQSAIAGRREAVLRDLQLLVERPGSDARACVVMAAAALGDQRLAESGLADPDPRVRASAALGLRGSDPASWTPSLEQRLRAVASRDRNDAARSCAAFALATPESKVKARQPRSAAVGLWTYAIPMSSTAWQDPSARAWGHFEGEELRLLAPVNGHAKLRWLIAPGIGSIDAYARSREPTGGPESREGFVF